MNLSNTKLSSRPVAIWLLVGVCMIIVQVLLGGITRITGSGLSITEWDPIMGAIPPLNTHEWEIAFDKYKQIAQFKYLNSYFTLHDFKSIFFWEWFHRLWARLMGVVFLIPFIIFLIRKKFKKEMIRPMIILFLLGALQGLVGWIMVMSGLDDSKALYVSHYKLAIHFILALGLLCYTLWFALGLLVPATQFVKNTSLKKFTIWITVFLVLQLIYGSFMAGLKAATAAPSWPSINGNFGPGVDLSLTNHTITSFTFLTSNPLMVQFIHRNLAYLITILIFVWYWKSRNIISTNLFRKTKWIPAAIVFLQVVLGVLTVLYSIYKTPFLWLAVAHQFNAMMLLLSLIWMLYIIRKQSNVAT